MPCRRYWAPNRNRPPTRQADHGAPGGAGASRQAGELEVGEELVGDGLGPLSALAARASLQGMPVSQTTGAMANSQEPLLGYRCDGHGEELAEERVGEVDRCHEDDELAGLSLYF
jgi:hypothetical protein